MAPTQNSIDNQITNDNLKVRCTRRLQFSHTTRVFFVPGLWEFTEEEIESMWLSDRDNTNIQLSTLKTIKRMRKGKNIDEVKYCTRGLEHMKSTECLEERKNNKALVCKAVLSEQKRQKRLGCYDPIRISNQSKLLSKKSKEEAIRLGASDAVAAAEIKLKRCTSKASHTVTKKHGQSESRIVGQSIERNDYVSISQKQALQISDPTQICQNVTCNETSLPTNKSFVTRENSGNNASENIYDSVECDISNNVFSRVLSKFSQGLEGESAYTKVNARRVSIRSSSQQSNCRENTFKV